MNGDRERIESTLSSAQARPVRIAIVGGGLAGLATATALADSRLQRQSNGSRLEIELFESRRMLGGRATSYRDPETGELIDNCQHVSLGCCTNFADFCRRTQIDHLFARESRLTFIGPNLRAHLVRRSRWLPAPLHLAPSLLGLSYLSRRERCGAALALRELGRSHTAGPAAQLTFGSWLRQHGQTERSIELFWSPVIVSALSEDVERAGFSACRKVFVDAFLRHATGYEMQVPRVPLRSLYEDHLGDWLQQRGVKLHLGCDICAVEGGHERASGVVLTGGERRPFDLICVAVPWHRVAEIFEPVLSPYLRFVKDLAHFEESPITSVHVWCARPLRLPGKHAVLPGRFSQWVFDRSAACPYYQVVISASREAASLSRDEVITRVRRDLEEISGEQLGRVVTRTKMITEHKAVFSPTVESDEWRPSQATSIPNLFLAGDWTATGWPATMEGAVRSGYLAAEGILAYLRDEETFLVPDLPTARMTRWLFGIR
jgi:squalene-associated FAD-dependent desaturase